jgi:hypothetical protein
MVIKKKILAFATLLLVAAPLFFLTGILIKQKIIQLGMEKKLLTTSLQTIVINQKNSSWVKPNKEISIDGKLFDVKSIAIVNGQTIATGLFDDDEDILQELLMNFVSNKNKSTSTANKLGIKFAFPVLYYDASPLFGIITPTIIDPNLLSFNQKKIPLIYFSISIPPPKFS